MEYINDLPEFEDVEETYEITLNYSHEIFRAVLAILAIIAVSALVVVASIHTV